MSTPGVDLGEIASLGKALGFLDADDNVRDDWLSRPSHYLSNVLADDAQRDALVAFVDDVLGGEAREVDADGLVWLPIVSHTEPKITVYLVLDPGSTEFIGIGVGVRLQTETPGSETEAYVPLFRAARTGHAVADAILIGQSPSAAIRLSTEITLGANPPLRGLGLTLRVPTAGAAAPTVALHLRGLQLPGATAPSDITVSAADLEDLDEAALRLVLGLVRAQADALAGNAGGRALRALVGLLGLLDDEVTPLPLAQLADRGPAALAEWFEEVVSSTAGRVAWTAHLANLLDGTVSADEVTFSVGNTAQVVVGVRVGAGAGGRPIITPALSIVVGAAAIQARLQADLLSLDLATRAVRALPAFSAFAQVGHGGAPLLTGDPGVVSLRVGLSLDAARRPVALIAADGVVIKGHPYATLDLSSPSAVADAATRAISAVLADLIAQLGPVGTAVQLLIGLTPPPSAPAATPLDVAVFMRDPVDALRAYWRGLLRDHPAGVTDLLASLRDLVSDDAAGAISGTGTAAAPWRWVIAGAVGFDLWMDPGDVLHIALAAAYAGAAQLGLRCTHVDTRLMVEVARVDLAAPSAAFLPAIEARITARATRGARTARFDAGPLVITADHAGARITWTPSAGLAFDVLTPNLAIELDDIRLPFALPVIDANGRIALDAAGWDALERLMGLLAEAAPVPWIGELAAALGWLSEGRPRLRLADLATDARTAIERWLTESALDDRGAVAQALRALARTLTGSAAQFGRMQGIGTADDPYRVALLPGGASPLVAMWIGPDGPDQPVSTAPEILQTWRPGSPALEPGTLADALIAEVATDVRDLASGRDLATGFAQLVDRWTGTDGRIVPPVVDPPGVTVHRVDDATAGQLESAADLTEVFETAPAVIVRVAVVGASAPLPWVVVPDGRLVDLRAANREPSSFTVPDGTPGEWFVALADRPTARLAAGDPDGVAGQTARLARVLSGFTEAVVIADAAAGHAAIRAAVPANVRAVVTLGTPLGEVSFTVLDDQPSADTLRLLLALLPSADEEPDDFVLARGRGLVRALADLLPLGDPGRELRPPASAAAAAVPVHAFFGVMSRSAVLAGITAIVAAGMAGRATARAEVPRRRAESGHLGVRVPIPESGSGVTVGGFANLELLAVGEAGLSFERRLQICLAVRGVSGWLVGGPGTGLGSGDRPSEGVRWLEARVSLPLGAGAASASLVLHEASVFGITRERWVIEPSASPLLPEVRVLLSLIGDRLDATAAASPPAEALRDVLRGLDIIAATGGVVADAVGHLLFDPAAHVSAAIGSAVSRDLIASGLSRLLTGVPGVTFDLAAGTVQLQLAGAPGEQGMLHWTADVRASADGSASARATLGSTGSSAAGGGLLVFETAPSPRAALAWHMPGGTVRTIPLWPDPDIAALERAFVRMLPAECLRVAFEYLRGLDETARPVVDAALGAVGLLSPSGSVLLPAGLLEDPRAWLQHESALGAGLNPARVTALLDALKPLLGIAGDPGVWQLSDGVAVRAASAGNQLQLALGVDTTRLTPISTPAGRVVLKATFAIAIPSGGNPAASLAVAAGIAGAESDRRAIHAEVGPSVRVFLRPGTGADVSLFPDPPGLGQLAGGVVSFALPVVLNALASQTGPGLPSDVAGVVRALGDGLGLRVGGTFDAERLQAWAVDPSAALRNALPTLTDSALEEIATALAPLLPDPLAAVFDEGTLRVAAGSTAAVTWRPAPFEIGCTVAVAGLAAVDRFGATVLLDADGLRSLTARLGPAVIDANGVAVQPYIEAVAGHSPATGAGIEVGLALDPDATRRVGGRWSFEPSSFALVTASGLTVSTDAADVALALVESVLDLVAGFAISTDAVEALLANPVGNKTVRAVLQNVVLDAAGSSLDAGLFDPDDVLRRVRTLAANLAGAAPSIAVGGGLDIGLSITPGRIVQVTLGVTGRVPLTRGDVVVSVEADSRWIRGQPQAEVAVGVIHADTLDFAPSLSAAGLGLRVSRSSGPLLDAGLSLGSIALHLFGQIGQGVALAGGVQLQLSDLAMSPSRAQGGNPVARGLTTDPGSPGPTPQFSPAIAVQKHGSEPVLLTLRAGDGDGPWWLVVQKGFGPIYIEQVGFGVTVREDQIQKISILLDGRISVFGLTAAVDDLSITFVVASDASLFDPERWVLDLAGLAVNADIGGVVLSGGLRKFGEGENVEYVGMLLARFAVYGLSVYGGYGSAMVGGQRFASFFAFGAVNGPIGGPPAFFLTGIGGGLGINRDLIFPQDLSRFGEFPFLKALDPAAQPAADPMAELASLRAFFPMRPGQFWFAAGISFTSFALVDGVAVVSVKIGDGLEIALLGLARMALPRPQFPLVSIELGLLARFSSREGVLWIQGQLTDNSWLLHESVRLTGGFAFVTWFKGPLAGHFVLTIGGYHPHFHRDGYPQVPRLGLRWSVSSGIVVKGEAYFALTSEALMAGGQLTATAKFGSAWAEVVFGAHGIVFFDPFSFDVEAYARISAGVTVDLWLGEVTFRISIGARIRVQGPKFHGRASFSVGPVGITVPFGDRPRPEFVPIPWADFVRKYLEEASPGVARVLTAIPGRGAVPPGTRSNGTESGTADGSPARPFEVLSEFELTITSTIPAQSVTAAWTRPGLPPPVPVPSERLGVAPIGASSAGSSLVLRLTRGGADHLGGLDRDYTVGAFPVGVWGQPQENDDRKVPQGRIIAAVDGVHVVARAGLVGTLPGEVKYHQVETGPRKPLPFAAAAAAREGFVDGADALVGVLPPAEGAAATFAAARPWLESGGTSRTAIAALERERTAPPRLGSLGEGLARRELARPDVALKTPATRPPVDVRVKPPVAIAVLASPILPETPRVRTTVPASEVPRVSAPTLSAVQASVLGAIPARLVRLPAAGSATEQRTVVSSGAVPVTEGAHAATSALATRGAPAEARKRLASFTSSLAGIRSAERTAQAVLRAGEIAVLQLPNARRDVDPQAVRPRLVCRGASRVVALSHGGEPLLDTNGSATGIDVPQGVERVVVLATGESKVAAQGLAGWHAGQQLAYLGWSTAMAAGCVVHAEGAALTSNAARFRAGYTSGAELVSGTTIVDTHFAAGARAVAIVLDEPSGVDAARGLRMSLDGAERTADPPLVVVAGHRSVIVYALVELRTPFTVSIASQDGWHLAGVIAAPLSAGELAARFVDAGLDELVQPLVSSRNGSVEISWTDGVMPRSRAVKARRVAKTPRPKAKKAKVAKPKAKATKAKKAKRPKRAKKG